MNRRREERQMRYLIVITLDGGETLNVWAENETAARAMGNLLSRECNGVESVLVHDTKKNKTVADWLGTRGG
jgi:hypothetical protein